MTFALLEKEPREYQYVITPTGDELPDMYQHWANLEVRLRKKFIILQTEDKDTLKSLIRKNWMLPNRNARWCTRQLKIEPIITYMQSLPEGSIQYVGLRADEEERKGLFGEDIITRFPLREWGWTIRQVLAYNHSLGIKIPRRTDCARCFYQSIGEWYELWRDYPKIFEDAEIRSEGLIGQTFRSDTRDYWPASLTNLRKEFEKGRIPKRSLNRLNRIRSSMCRVCSF